MTRKEMVQGLRAGKMLVFEMADPDDVELLPIARQLEEEGICTSEEGQSDQGKIIKFVKA